MILARRRFLFGASAVLVAAPAIVRVAANLMPISTAAQTAECPECGRWRARRMEFMEKVVRPPHLAAPVLRNEPASIMPGHITYVNPSKEGFRPLFEMGGLFCAKCGR